MSAKMRMVLTAALLASAALAKIVVCEQAHAQDARVAGGSSCHLVVWFDTDRHYVRAARVSIEPEFRSLDPSGLDVASAPTTGNNYCVGSTTPPEPSSFFVAWSWHDASADYCSGRIVLPDGTFPGEPFSIDATPRDFLHQRPAVGFRQSGGGGEALYLVVWEQKYADYDFSRVYGVRVTPEGTVIDDDPILIYTGGTGSPDRVLATGVASDGDRFLVVWCEYNTADPHIGGAIVEANGMVHEPFVVSAERPVAHWPDAAFDAAEDRYQVTFLLRHLTPSAWVREYSRDGVALDDAISIAPSVMSYSVPAAAGTDMTALCWLDPESRPVWRGLTGGRLAGVTQPVADEHARSPDAACDGRHYVAVWVADDNSVCAETLSFWPKHFYSGSNMATAYNQGRHLALDPVTGWLHMVYMTAGDSVLYSYSTDGGQNWYPYEFVGYGTYPCVVCENQGTNPVWVCYQTPSHGIECKARLGLNQWATFPVYTGANADAPSMSIRYVSAADGPAVYVAYPIFDGQNTAVMFNVVRLYGGVGPQEVVASSNGPFLQTPTLSTTPGDLVHCAWELYHLDLGYNRIYYKMRSTVGQWPPDPEEVSPELNWPTEPAFYPSVDAFGDRVYAVWRGSNGAIPPVGEAWRKERYIVGQPQWWHNPQNQSLSPSLPSDYPQVSTQYAALFQEWGRGQFETWDIWANVNGIPSPFHESPTASQYPNLVAVPPDPTHDITFVHGLWTEAREPGLIPPYEVMFKTRTYGGLDRGEEFDYYDCEVGDSALGRFCLLRDGTARWREYRVDYGRSNLRYRLPYLNPNCIYKLMAVLYQTGRDTWRQRLSLDGVPAGEVTHRPLRPETVWVALPRELYSADCAVELDIAKLAGDYAAVAALKVYQFYPFREKGEVEGGGVASSPGSGQEPGLFLAPPEPAPFAASANISYHVPTPRHVALRVYDVQGRLVVTLASGLHAAGAYRVRWDGQSTSGARVAAGTYLVRLESESTSRTRKLVLTR